MNNEETKTMLNEAIERQFSKLEEDSFDTEKRSKAVNDLDKLYRLKIDEMRTESEITEKVERRVTDELIRKQEIKERIKNRFIELGIGLSGIILPLIFYGKWMKEGLKFEETGTFTSMTFRGLFNNFKPTKK